MKTFKRSRIERLLVLIVTIAVLALLNPSSAVGKKMVSKFKPIDGENDIHHFRTTAQMYRTAPVKPYGKEAARLIARMNTDPVRSLLQKLNPYRKSSEVQEALKKWKTLWVSRIKAGKKPNLRTGATLAFKGANSYYKRKSKTREGNIKILEVARKKYLEVLKKYPTHLDARNNLALCELHLGNDLAAQLELETLRELSPVYMPAMINLTVVYERLRRSKRAEKLAHETHQKHPKIPQAVFNAGWYLNNEGKYDKARALLLPLVLAKKPNNKYWDLRRLNDRQLAKKSGISLGGRRKGGKKGFWQRGLLEVIGGKSGWLPWVFSIIGFLICSAVALPIWAGMCTGVSKKRSTPFITSMVAGGIFFIFAWGAPFKWVWIPLVIYAILFSVLSNEIAKSG